MPRAGLDQRTITECAADMLDATPDDPLSLAALAQRLGVKTPSLYKHVNGLAGIHRGVMIQAKYDLGQVMAQAAVGRATGTAIADMSHAYRQWALAHPGQYPLTVRAPAPEDDEDQAASESILRVVFAVLDGYNLHEDDAVDATRFFRSALHGFVALETTGAFALPVDIERSFTRVVDSVIATLATWSVTSRPPQA